MREIKFRAWDKSLNKFVYPKLWDNTMPSNWESWYELTQYTGLKDKNGKEIYDGDIVSAWSAGAKGKFIIKWRQGGSPCWILYPAWQSKTMWYISATHHTKGKQFIDVTGKIEETNLEGYYDDGLEIIGNIYEGIL